MWSVTSESLFLYLMCALQIEGETFQSRWCTPYAYFGFRVAHADVRCDTILYCFLRPDQVLWKLPESFTEKFQQVTIIRDSFTRNIIAAVLSINIFLNLPIHLHFFLVHWACGFSQRVFEQTQMGRRNRKGHSLLIKKTFLEVC